MMTDRDTFAAAALTGLLAQGDDGSFSEESYARAAYRWADAMLRERKVPDGTGDTPAAHATRGEGSEQRECTEPVAWGVAGHKGLLYATAISRMDAVDMQSEHECDTEVVPLYRHPPVTEPMPTEKRAEVCAGPLAWAAIRENGQPLWLSYDRSGAEGMVNGMAEVVPLYRRPPCQDFSQKNLTLTDAEREAVESAIWDYEQNDDDDGCARMVAVLRGLLARLGGGSE